MRFAVLGLMCISLLAAGQAGAVMHDSGALPSCDARPVLEMLKDQFATAQERPWRAGLAIERLAPISQSGLEFAGDDALQRRFCRARAKLSNGAWPAFFYVIEQQPRALGPRVTYCLPDPGLFAGGDGDCRLVKPSFADR